MVASGVQNGSTESGVNQRAARKIESRIQIVENPKEEGEGYKNNCVGTIAVQEAARTHHRWERQLEEKTQHDNKPRVVWLSLEPLTGMVHLYPWEVAARIQAAHISGRRSVPLAGFEGFDGDIVYFGNEADGELSSVKTSSGRFFDVCCMIVSPDIQEVCVHVAWEKAWRMFKTAIPGKTEERRVPLSGAEVVVAPASATMPPIDQDRRQYYMNPAWWN